MSETDPTVINRLRNMVIETLDLPPDSLPMDGQTSLFGTGLGIDSLDALLVITSVEEEFDVLIDDSEINVENLESLDSIAKLITRKLET